MVLGVEKAIRRLASESAISYDSVTIVNGASAGLPEDGIDCRGFGRVSFTVESTQSLTIYIQGRVEASDTWCTKKKLETDTDISFTGATPWIEVPATMSYMRLFATNSSGSDASVKLKARLGR